MSSKFKPEKYKDTYQKRLKEIIEAKKNDKDLDMEEETPEATDVDDLVEQLKKSLELA